MRPLGIATPTSVGDGTIVFSVGRPAGVIGPECQLSPGPPFEPRCAAERSAGSSGARSPGPAAQRACSALSGLSRRVVERGEEEGSVEAAARRMRRREGEGEGEEENVMRCRIWRLGKEQEDEENTASTFVFMNLVSV